MANLKKTAPNTWVAADPVDADWRPMEGAELPPATLPPTQPAEAITIDTGGGKSFVSVQGSHQDRQRALERTMLAAVAAEAITVAGLLLVGWLQIRSGAPFFGAAWVATTGALGFLTIAWLKGNDNAHTPSGVDRQRNKLASKTAIKTHAASVEAWRDVALTEIHARYAYQNRMLEADHTQRMKRLEGGE